MSGNGSAGVDAKGGVDRAGPRPVAAAPNDWMRPVWICLAGERRPLPGVPSGVVFVHSDWTESRDAARRCAAFLRRRGIRADTRPTDAFDPAVVTADVVRVADAEGYARILLNWTGGTKPMALGALAAMPRHVPYIYYDTRRGILVNGQAPYRAIPVGAGSTLCLEEQLSLNSDASVVTPGTSGVDCPASSAVLFPELDADPRLLDDLSAYRLKTLEPLKDRRGWKPVPAGGIAAPFEARKPVLCRTLAQAMQTDSMAHKAGAFRPNARGLRFLDGTWMEYYVEAKVRDALQALGDPPTGIDVRRNLEVRWPGRGRAATNEIDVAFVRGDRLFVVSCTTANESNAAKRHQAAEDLAARFGGRFARAMLASTLPGTSLDILRARRRATTSIPPFVQWRDPEGLLREWFAQ